MKGVGSCGGAETVYAAVERRLGWRRQLRPLGADAVMFTLSVSAAVGFSAPEPKAAAGGNMNGAYVVSSGGKVGVPFNTDRASLLHKQHKQQG